MLTVLIADDEPHVIDLIRLTLEDERIAVIDALDGETALAHAEAMRPELIFLDVNLPDMSGLEVCARLRSDPRFATTKIVMLTAAAQESDIARGFAAGANHYLTKPFSPVRLISLVESVVPHAAVWQRELAPRPAMTLPSPIVGSTPPTSRPCAMPRTCGACISKCSALSTSRCSGWPTRSRRRTPTRAAIPNASARGVAASPRRSGCRPARST